MDHLGRDDSVIDSVPTGRQRLSRCYLAIKSAGRDVDRVGECRLWGPPAAGVLLGPPDTTPNDLSRLLKVLERVLPDILLFQTPKEPFDHPIPLRPVERNELLLEAIVTTGLPEPSTLKDQAVVTSQYGGFDLTRRPDPGQAVLLRRLASPPSLNSEARTGSRHFVIIRADYRRPISLTHRGYRGYASHPTPTARRSGSSVPPNRAPEAVG